MDDVSNRDNEHNAAVAASYEEALWDIAKMCGWVPEVGCTGCPQDAEDVAREYVAKLLKSNA